jgi:hypothetical protein
MYVLVPSILRSGKGVVRISTAAVPGASSTSTVQLRASVFPVSSVHDPIAFSVLCSVEFVLPTLLADHLVI